LKANPKFDDEGLLVRSRISNTRASKFAIYGGVTFALVYSLIYYLLKKEFTAAGLFGGLVWGLAAITPHYFVRNRN
jgi:ammonia channel protein AmtB